MQVELRNRYKFRIILDEGNTFGVLGTTGRGLTEEQEVDPHEVDIIVGSLANALCTAGGFCVGSNAIVAHQRTNSHAYTYSAALPAMMATSTSCLLADFFPTETYRERCRRLAQNVSHFRALIDVNSEVAQCVGWEGNPMVLITLKKKLISSRGWTDGELDLLMVQVIRKVWTSSLTSILLLCRYFVVTDLTPLREY